MTATQEVTDNAVEAVARLLYRDNPIIGGRDWEWCVTKHPALADRWRACSRAVLEAAGFDRIQKERSMAIQLLKPFADKRIIDSLEGDHARAFLEEIGQYVPDGG